MTGRPKPSKPQSLEDFVGLVVQVDPHDVTIKGRKVHREGFRGTVLAYEDGGRRGLLVHFAAGPSRGLKIAPARAVPKLVPFLKEA